MKITEPPELPILKEKLAQLKVGMEHMKLKNRVIQFKVREVWGKLASTMCKVEESLGFSDKKEVEKSKVEEKDDEEEEMGENQQNYYDEICDWLRSEDYPTRGYSYRSTDPEEMYTPIEVTGTLQEREKLLSDRLLVEVANWKENNLLIKDQKNKIVAMEQEIFRLKEGVFVLLADFRSQYPWHNRLMRISK